MITTPTAPGTAPSAVTLSLPSAFNSQNTRYQFESAEDIAPTSTLVGPTAKLRSFPNLLHILRQANDMEVDAMRASTREFLFDAHVMHGIIQVRQRSVTVFSIFPLEQ